MSTKRRDIYIAHAPGEDAIAARLAEPLEAAGYTVHHRGTALVGDSFTAEASRVLEQGGPMVVCITVEAMGTDWAPELVAAVRSGYGWERILPVRIDARARTKTLFGHDIAIADCSTVFDTGVKELLSTLHQKFPLTDPETAAPPGPDIRPWLRALVDRVSHIRISGIGSGVGRTRDASRYPIEQLYTALRSRGGMLETGGRGLTVADLLPRHHRLLIEGQPGAGKTTFLSLTAAMLGRDWQGLPAPGAGSWRKLYLGLDDGAPPRVPLFLKLSELVFQLEKDRLTNRDCRCRLLDLLDSAAGATPGPEWRAHWHGLLERGEAILLLDGLDEVADDTLRERVFAIFRDACTHWDKTPMVVTSRPIAVEAVKALGFHHTVIEPFGEPEIRDFINRWVAALHNLPIGVRPDGAAGEKADVITAAVLTRPAIRRMAANPVMLTCLCVVHWNEGDLPEGRARLYKAVIRWLISARETQRKAEGFNGTFAHEALAALALALMTGGKDGGKVALFDFEASVKVVTDLTKRHFPTENSRHHARRWLRFECLSSGIVEERAGGRIGFWHLTFQEYLAAVDLAGRGDDDAEGDWWPVLKGRLDELQWRETVDLFPGTLIDEGGARRVDLLLDRVAASLGRSRKLADGARTFGILGRLQATLRAYDYRPSSAIAALMTRLGERCLAVFTPEGAAKVSVRLRIAAAEALGRGGDPRLTGDTFIPVPGTTIALGKYPVTVQEFQVFLEAGGYDEPEFWDEKGWAWRQKMGRGSPDNWAEQLDHPNRPVVSVSWYEAMAWCNWRSALTGTTVRLPILKEWLIAASPDGRTFPWGEEWCDRDRANVGPGAGPVTPVGVYPDGSGAFGHCDLVGNVCEFGMDEHKPSSRADSDLMQSFYGSCWIDSLSETSDNIVRWLIPGGAAFFVGFRCARVLPFPPPPDQWP